MRLFRHINRIKGKLNVSISLHSFGIVFAKYLSAGDSYYTMHRVNNYFDVS